MLKENQKAKATVGAIIDATGSLGILFTPEVFQFVNAKTLNVCCVLFAAIFDYL